MKEIEKEVSIESMEKLAKILNDSPIVKKMAGTEFEIRALRNGTQWLIAEEVIKICNKESANLGDIVRDFATNIPSVVHILTLCILNDKKRIFKDIDKRIYTKEYKTVYDTIMWETAQSEWMALLVEVFNMLDISFFLQISESVKIFNQTTLMRKTAGQKLSPQEQK